MAPAWLTAQPVAHRGFHDAAAGRIENTLTAVMAAVERGFAIEVDLQLSADGEAMVHHDEKLGRLTEGSGELVAMTAADLARVPFKTTGDHIPTLTELLDAVAGRVPLVIELKSLYRPDKDQALVRRTCEVLTGYNGTGYAGPVALMSFDPEMVAGVRRLAPQIPRGITADACTEDEYWGFLSTWQRFSLRHILHYPRTRPDFIAYGVNDLPQLGVTLLRRLLGLKLLTWMVRTPEQRRKAEQMADQMIFEGFTP